MNSYYDELGLSGDRVQWAGWRRRIEQALRFEVALEALDDRGVRTVLDVGCGPGGLFDYIQATGREVDYLGIDCYAPAIDYARQRHKKGRFERWSVYDARLDASPGHRPFDGVVAIGTLVSGDALHGDQERRGRVARLWERLEGLGQGVGCLIALNQEVLTRRPVMDLDPALFGATVEELEGLQSSSGRCYYIRQDFLQTDLAMYFVDDEASQRKLAARDFRETMARVLEGPWGRDISLGERAWIWAEAGYREEARRVLESCEGPIDELGRIVSARLEL